MGGDGREMGFMFSKGVEIKKSELYFLKTQCSTELEFSFSFGDEVDKVEEGLCQEFYSLHTNQKLQSDIKERYFKESD